MLLSFSKRFIFIANTKTGSSTVEQRLRRHAEILIPAPKYGKHMSYGEIAERFEFSFTKSGTPIEQYFRFGVVRDPVEWVVSWFNYRHRDNMTGKKKRRSTQGKDFEAFAAKQLKTVQKHGSLGKQYTKFYDKDGNLAVDYLIPLERLDDDLQIIATELGVKKKIAVEKGRKKVSTKIISVSEVPPELAAQLRQHFSRDLELFEKARDGGFGDLREILRGKKSDERIDETEDGDDEDEE